MSRKPSPAKIGAFVLIGAAILVLTIGLLGSARLFARPVPMILYFRDSVNGLAVGSPVKYKGVTIGQVRSISLASVKGADALLIPVVVEIDKNAFETEGGADLPITVPAGLKRAVDNGLRGSLETESLVTGRLYVSLDVIPRAGPPVYVGGSKYPEIPTQSTGLVEFIKNLSKIDLPTMVRQLNEILSKLNTSLGELKVKELNERLAKVLVSVESLIASTKWTETVDSVRQTSDKAREVLVSVEKEVTPLTSNLNQTANSARETFAELQRATADLRRVLTSESPVMSDLQRALEETALAARSLRELADELTRNPSALLKGRYQGENQ
jgi:paraquat-inducible protein B